MDIKIRRARKDDCVAMLALIRELAVYERAPDEVTVDIKHFAESGFGANPVWWGFIAEADQKIIGFALYYVRYSTWKGQKMYLEDIIVTEEWRGRGAGKMLMDSLISEAKDRGFAGLTWQVLEWNEPAIKFYERYKTKFDGEWVNVSLDF
ncbi:MAG TPA: GNAT family N-acetyltransferase [Flavipsychrobacter sp.]|nr:GNAT family N-acetyltransferase [Flavipsychrobacter sp.]